MCWEEGNTGEGAKEMGIRIVVSRCNAHLKPLASLDGISAQKRARNLHIVWEIGDVATAAAQYSLHGNATYSCYRQSWRHLKGLEKRRITTLFQFPKRRRENEAEGKEEGMKGGWERKKARAKERNEYEWRNERERERRENMREREGKAHEYWHCLFCSESDLPYHNPQDEENINILKEWRCFYGKPRNFSL